MLNFLEKIINIFTAILFIALIFIILFYTLSYIIYFFELLAVFIFIVFILYNLNSLGVYLINKIRGG